jgi:hypothetical protein
MDSAWERLFSPGQPGGERRADLGEIASVIGPETRHAKAVVADIDQILAVSLTRMAVTRGSPIRTMLSIGAASPGMVIWSHAEPRR